jgi:hypothetical protein
MLSAMSGEDPRTWLVPSGEWHPDFDPAVEVEMLRAFATRLIGRHPQYGVRLVVTEPGYMHVDVIRTGKVIASVLIAAGPKDGQKWSYLYDLASGGKGGLSLEFERDGIDGAVDQLHAFVERDRVSARGFLSI